MNALTRDEEEAGRCRDLVARLEDQRRALVGELTGWAAERLVYKPSAGEWSATEVVDHLVKTESAILSACETGLRSPHRIAVRDRLGVQMINRIFQSETKVKVPESARVVWPEAGCALAEVLERWEQTRAKLAVFVEEAPLDGLHGGIFRHPVGGWMNLRQVLEFFSVHMVHHGYQLRRLRGAQG